MVCSGSERGFAERDTPWFREMSGRSGVLKSLAYYSREVRHGDDAAAVLGLV